MSEFLMGHEYVPLTTVLIHLHTGMVDSRKSDHPARYLTLVQIA
jgi:hypothetical protein